MKQVLTLNHIDDLLAHSGATLREAERYFPGDPYLRQVNSRQKRLERERHGFSNVNPNLGFPFLIAAAVVGVTGLAAFGARVWQQHKETQAVEEKTDLIKQLVNQGYDPNDISKLFASQSGFDSVLGKVVLLVAVLTGLFVFLKVK